MTARIVRADENRGSANIGRGGDGGRSPSDLVIREHQPKVMKPGFEPGIVREVEITVTEAMCPAFDGRVVHRCYSTWSAAHHMEIAARKVLVDFLEDGEEGVGAHVSVDHLAPCGVGKTVRIRAELIEIIRDHHTRVICDVSAYEGQRLLARGKQVQVVMDKEKLKRLIERS